jgi:membrane protein
VTFRSTAAVWRAALAGWWNDNVPRMGASLAYYTLFSLAPILVIALAIAGSVFGEEAVRGQVEAQLRGLVGETGAKAIQSVVLSANQSQQTGPATVFGLVAFVVGATGVFVELEAALNDIWKVKSKSANRGIVGMIWDRLISFGLVAIVGFLLLVSLLVSAGLAALGHFAAGRLPLPELVWQAIDFVFSVAVIAVLFAMVYKVLPNVRLPWRDAWAGGVVTALLFSVGKNLIGLYIGQSALASSYGAAASVIVLLAWVYYAAQVVLLGAEFTRSYSTARAKAAAQPPPAGTPASRQHPS